MTKKAQVAPVEIQKPVQIDNSIDLLDLTDTVPQTTSQGN